MFRDEIDTSNLPEPNSPMSSYVWLCVMLRAPVTPRELQLLAERARKGARGVNLEEGHNQQWRDRIEQAIAKAHVRLEPSFKLSRRRR